MMLLTTRRRTGWPAAGRRKTGARGSLRHAATYHRGAPPLRAVRSSGTMAGAAWWHRAMDDQELVGAKLLTLAALLALTAVLERVV